MYHFDPLEMKALALRSHPQGDEEVEPAVGLTTVIRRGSLSNDRANRRTIYPAPFIKKST